MGQVLHGCATTTEEIRRAIQLCQESVRALAKRYGISPTTVQKWRRRSTTADAAMGPKEPRSTVLSIEEEAIVVAFRRHTLLPLDDCLWPPADHSPPHPLVAAPLPRAARHQPPARDRGRQAEEETLRRLCHRLLSPRHRRPAHRGRQAPPLRGRRLDLEARLRPPGGESQHRDRLALPQGTGRRRALQDPHGAHRQSLARRPAIRSAKQARPAGREGRAVLRRAA